MTVKPVTLKIMLITLFVKISQQGDANATENETINLHFAYEKLFAKNKYVGCIRMEPQKIHLILQYSYQHISSLLNLS